MSSVQRLQELIRFETVSALGPQGSYQKCAEWLLAYLEEVGIQGEIIYPMENKPVVVGKWIGTEPTLPSILLNSHYDVVPVMRQHWDYDPFGGDVMEDGFIVGRGTQDMKCVCVQYVEAISMLMGKGFKPRRTVYLTFVPDEEIGGSEGFGAFLETKTFADMQPIAFALDEGLANPTNAYTVFYGERTPWWIIFTSNGPTGHGSRFVKDTAMEKLVELCNKAIAFRKKEENKLGADTGCKHGDMKKRNLGDVTTINLTMLRGGVTQNNGNTFELNVIPTEAQAGFDVRISPEMNTQEFRSMLDAWCLETGTSWKFAEWTTPLNKHYLTSLNTSDNPWWGIFSSECENQGLVLETEIFPAATDSRFVRKLGIPALGFSPMNNSEILLHEHNEKIHKDVFLSGIHVYCGILEKLLSAPRLDTEI